MGFVGSHFYYVTTQNRITESHIAPENQVLILAHSGDMRQPLHERMEAMT